MEVLATRSRLRRTKRRRRCGRCGFRERTIEVPEQMWLDLGRLAEKGATCREIVLTPGQPLRIVAAVR